jgi:uncharacterized protein
VDWPFITDPYFYAAAIPAVLLMGISKSGFGGGMGALAVPLLALGITVPEAAAIMMPLLFVMDASSFAAFWRHYDRKLLFFLVPFGLVGTLVGTLTFGLLNPQLVAGILGSLTLLFLAQRLAFPPRPDSRPLPRWAGGLLGIASGFTSFVSHAGSPPLNVYVMPLRLPPLVFSATLAMLFTILNLSKWIPYAWLGLLDLRNMATSLVLMPLAPLGVWIGVRIARRIDPVLFYRLMYLGMLLAGLKLVYDGFIVPALRSA